MTVSDTPTLKAFGEESELRTGSSHPPRGNHSFLSPISREADSSFSRLVLTPTPPSNKHFAMLSLSPEDEIQLVRSSTVADSQNGNTATGRLVFCQACERPWVSSQIPQNKQEEKRKGFFAVRSIRGTSP